MYLSNVNVSIIHSTFVYVKTGIEEIAEEHSIEENMALVTFGGTARIAHHLTNDYESLRDCIGTWALGRKIYDLSFLFIIIINEEQRHDN